VRAGAGGPSFLPRRPRRRCGHAPGPPCGGWVACVCVCAAVWAAWGAGAGASRDVEESRRG